MLSKKLVFIALAVVAFSGVAMAGTEEIKETEILLITDPCQQVCHLSYDLARREGADHGTADKVAELAYANCIASRKGLEQEAAISQ